MFWIVLLMAQAAVPSQTERGEALFFDTQQGCASCHLLKGKGTAVGPDLAGIGRLAPQAIAMAARSTVTQYVQVAKLKSGGSFPAMTGKKDEKAWSCSIFRRILRRSTSSALGHRLHGQQRVVETPSVSKQDQRRKAGRHRGLHQVRRNRVEKDRRSRRRAVGSGSGGAFAFSG